MSRKDGKREREAIRGEWRKLHPPPPFTMERWFEMPRKWTFQMPKLRAWVVSRCTGEVLNLFGGITRIPGAVHNDLNAALVDESSGEISRDACDLTQWRDMADRFDTVIFDPPYSAHQAVVSYGTRRQQQVSHARDVVEYVLRPGGRVISLGFNSTGMSESRQFQKEAIALVNCGGSHNDYILMSEVHVP